MSEDRIFYVYVLFRPWDGSPFYVGKGLGRRWLSHEWAGSKHRNWHLARILTKAKRLGMDIPKVKICVGLTEAEAFEIEIAFIKAIGRFDQGIGPLVNFTDGGDGASGTNISEGTREKIRISKLGKPRSQETIEKMRAAMRGKPAHNRGKKASPEARLNMSLAHKGKPSQNRGKVTPMEVRQKIRLSRLGQIQSAESHIKRSVSLKKSWAERRAKLAEIPPPR